jgi:hypothetical protein
MCPTRVVPRSILQRWKRALHVPLRLDVYYQHEDGQRELLERWCLEYAPRMTAAGECNIIPRAFSTSDPIVQLRQVCKNIVIWLRTLYCWSRMLPAQALRKVTTQSSLQNPNVPPPIGFSIYVVSEGQDDVSGLMTNQGFHSQGQPHGVLTPYGELGWKVFYAPKSVVQRLLLVSQAGQPHYSSGVQPPTSQNDPSTATTVTMDMAQQYNNRATVATRGGTTKTQPIPMQQHPSQQQYAQQTYQQQYGTGGVARSAPQQQNRLYRRSVSDYDGANGYSHAGRSYHHRHQLLARMGKATSGDIDERPFSGHDEDGDDGNGVSGNGRPVYRPVESQPQRHQQPLSSAVNSRNKDDRPPTKNLSALSLALMMSDEQSASVLNHSLDTADETPDGSGGEEGGTHEESTKGTTTTVEEAAAAEKRRAALHNAPPQLFTTNSPAAVAASPLLRPSGLTGAATGGMGTHHPRVAAAAGEYGYAYNNHIPTLEQYHHHGSGPDTPVTPNASNTSSGPYQQHHVLHPPSVSATRMPLTMEAATNAPPGTYSPSFRPSTPLGTTPLGTTPPGYLLGATPGTHLLVNALIPPRSSVTPPFVRPMGFVGEPPSQPLPPSAASASNVQAATARMAELDSALHQHQTSLDLLHSSPFQYPPSYAYYSIHNNNNVTSQTASAGSQLNHALDPNAAFLSDYYHRSAHMSSDDPRLSVGQEIYDDFGDDMPFAVDAGAGFGSAAAQSASGGGAASSGHPTTGLAMMTEASLVASMCTTAPKRLAMFDSKMGRSSVPGTTDHEQDEVRNNDLSAVMDSLADQLAEFKSFGASLTASASGTYAATATASSSS